MKIPKTFLPILAIAGAFSALIPFGCGLITAPITVPMAVAANANFSITVVLVDQEGKPLEDVLLNQQLDHRFWEPMSGSTDTDERRLLFVDRKLKVQERGQNLNLDFTRDGYYDVSLKLNADDPKTVHSNLGDWPLVPDFPVVMMSRAGKDANLRNLDTTFDCAAYPRRPVLDLDRLATADASRIVYDFAGEDSGPARPGTLYLTLTREAPHPINAHGDLDPSDLNLPGEVTLHISGDDGGFVRIAPRVGYAPIQTSDTAPAEGYQPTFQILRDRLKEMRTGSAERVIESHEYFFFRAHGRFGKGLINWSRQRDRNALKPPPLSFRTAVWIQPQAGEINLRSRADSCTCK
jgi:hypothetical protein